MLKEKTLKEKLKKYKNEEYFPDIIWSKENQIFLENAVLYGEESSFDEKMKIVKSLIPLSYREFGSEDLPSIVDSFQDVPYDHQDEILEYLSREWKDNAGNLEPPIDIVTGNFVEGIINDIFNDGEYSWPSMLAYYVEKYNMRLPKCFENHILRKLEEERLSDEMEKREDIRQENERNKQNGSY